MFPAASPAAPSPVVVPSRSPFAHASPILRGTPTPSAAATARVLPKEYAVNANGTSAAPKVKATATATAKASVSPNGIYDAPPEIQFPLINDYLSTARKQTIACDTLGLDCSQDVTRRQLKKKYHDLSRRYHPDRNSAETAASDFQKIGVAFDALDYIIDKLLFVPGRIELDNIKETESGSYNFKDSATYEYIQEVIIDAKISGMAALISALEDIVVVELNEHNRQVIMDGPNSRANTALKNIYALHIEINAEISKYNTVFENQLPLLDINSEFQPSPPVAEAPPPIPEIKSLCRSFIDIIIQICNSIGFKLDETIFGYPSTSVATKQTIADIIHTFNTILLLEEISDEDIARAKASLIETKLVDDANVNRHPLILVLKKKITEKELDSVELFLVNHEVANPDTVFAHPLYILLQKKI